MRPRWTLRLRLTLLYGALFLLAGAILLAITYGLVANQTRTSVLVRATRGPKVPVAGPVGGGKVFFAQAPKTAAVPAQLPPGLSPAERQTALAYQRGAQTVINQNRADQLDTLLTKSGVALGIMAFVSIGLGWLMAGRALRPVRTMSLRARGISERNLHERLALEGPNDELKELGDTFDGLLGRLEAAFESQRRFVANASHELRTPITVERTLVEVALADPEATTASLRATCERVLAAGEQQERLIEALLTLARSQRGLEAREPVDLSAITHEALQGVPHPSDIRVRSELGESITIGDPALVERLVVNLLQNAINHNHPNGWVTAATGVRGGRPTLSVTNSGAVIPTDQAALLTEPFRRLNGNRTGHSRGVGLGLSIVDAIAAAHGAELRATPREEGGLEVEVAFPAAVPAPV
jgi:signal transduction histidine kinase